MVRTMYCFCLLWVLSSCKKMALTQDPKYTNFRITAGQHLRAIHNTKYWDFPTTVEVKDSVFYYQHHFGASLGEVIVYYRWNDVEESYEETHAVCDWEFIHRYIHTCLKNAYVDILTGSSDRSYWRPLLWFDADVYVKRRGMSDTIANFLLPFSSTLFD